MNSTAAVLNVTEKFTQSEVLNTWATVIKSVICVSTILTNSAVFVVFGVDERLRNYRHNAFILNMAVIDFLTGVVSEPLIIYQEYYTGSSLTAGACVFFRLVYAGVINGTFWAVTVTTIDKFVYIRYPLRYDAFVTTKLVAAMIAGVWVYMVASAVAVELTMTVDMTDWTGACYPLTRFETGLALMVLDFVIPVGLMVALNAKIFRIITSHARRMRTGSGGREDEELRKKIAASARTIFLLVGSFFCTVLPFFLFVAIESGCDYCHRYTVGGMKTNQIFLWFCMLNSAINPVLYASDVHFKRAYCKLFRLCSGPRSDRVHPFSTNTNGISTE